MQDIEAGWWHIRAVARKANGATHAVYSKSYYCDSAEQVRKARVDFKVALLDADFVHITLTHTVRSKLRIYNHMIW